MYKEVTLGWRSIDVLNVGILSNIIYEVKEDDVFYISIYYINLIYFFNTCFVLFLSYFIFILYYIILFYSILFYFVLII